MKRIVPSLLTVALCTTAAAAPLWEIEPQHDSTIRSGKVSVVGGRTNEAGVRFAIKNLDIQQPLEIVLAAEGSAPLKLVAYKDSPDQPLIEQQASAGSPAIAKFRTSDSVGLVVSGPADARYQLFTWQGPRVVIDTPPAFVPVNADGSLVGEMPAPRPAPAPPPTTPPASPPPPVPDAPPSAVPTILVVLLAAILVAIVGLAIVVWLTRSKGRRDAAAVLVAIGLAASAGRAQDDPFAPKKVEWSDVWKDVNTQIGKIRDILDTYERAGIKVDVEELKVRHPDDKPEEPGKPPSTIGALTRLPGQIVTNTKLLLAFLEEFGLIDPREAAVQPDYDPTGQPAIPSRCAGTGECGECFDAASADLDKARKLLEDQYVIYKQTELAAGRIHEMADAAAGLSPYAQMAWSVAKANPSEKMNVAQKKFYDTYDANLEKLLSMANEGLIGVGACERESFKDFDWYSRYGMVYYNFLKDRYTRK